MVNEDLLGGIETAIYKGESLESAMLTLYNSGYSKEDIEWAAKAYKMKNPQLSAKPLEQRKILKPVRFEEEETTQVLKKPLIKQDVSTYEQASQFKERVILVLLLVSLLLLLGVLAGVFLFKEQLVNFLNDLFIG